eukprot:Gregarina_sp_Poly_1__3915@NODE_2172_length_2560_cov_79_930606_g1401_i0_p1_GENE_NODE_2172_length_2560_cov_79_930606_g1401_i0NODE_2172_length_2560_cov_79_930606_g1401_i0_p1_ORF_typecomplete_len801_score62_67STT3/PF02516_14/2_2e144PTPS_related/PF10131_9/2_2e03PTPS_related/PF10131_9/0_0057_NODE_2172_length_2560_cov_79_930606_g1401_i01122514
MGKTKKAASSSSKEFENQSSSRTAETANGAPSMENPKSTPLFPAPGIVFPISVSSYTNAFVSDSLSWMVLILIGLLCFFVRLFAVIRYESVIHEYDPYFNYRTTKFLTQEGYMEFWNWFDEASWYPLGRVIGQTLFPGLMTTAYIGHTFLNFIGLPLDIRDVCVFIAPVFAAFCAWSTYGLTVEATGNKGAGMLAALFSGIAPAYLSRSTAGGFDNEAIAIFTLVFSFYTFLRAMNRGTTASVLLANFAYFYMVTSWGGYVFVTNVVAIYILMLIFMDRFNKRHFVVYAVWYVIGTALCLNIPFVAYAAITSSEHMLSHGVFVVSLLWLLQRAVLQALPSGSSAWIKRLARRAIIVGFIGFVCLFLVLLATGRTRWSGRSMTLLDPTYASKHIPIIASVSEHQPTTWAQYHFDLGASFLLVPAGLWVSFTSTRETAWFLGLFGMLSAHFSGVMVRLMLVLAPAAACLSALGASTIMSSCFDSFRSPSFTSLARSLISFNAGKKKEASKKDSKPLSVTTPSKWEWRLLGNRLVHGRMSKVSAFVGLCCIGWICYRTILQSVWSSAYIYSHPSVVISGQLSDGSKIIQDDFREAYTWFKHNTHPNARIMSWWDYGYQACYMANRTIVVDNNTWNNTHIATVGLAFGVEEDMAYPVIQHLDVDFVFVVFGGVSRYPSDDLNKFLWMVRIGGGVFQFMPRDGDYYTSTGHYQVGHQGSPILTKSLMYRLSYHNFHNNSVTEGYDVLRRAQIADVGPLKYFEEAYTTSSWQVRIFKVKKPSNRLGYGETPLRNVLRDPPGDIHGE